MINPIHHCCLVYSLHYHRKQWGKCSCIIVLNTIFFWLDWFYIFDALAFILQEKLTVFLFKTLLPSCYNFYFETTIFVVEKIVVVNKASQAVMFVQIQSFRILHDSTTMHAYTNRLLLLFSSLFYSLCIEGHNFHCLVD